MLPYPLHLREGYPHQHRSAQRAEAVPNDTGDFLKKPSIIDTSIYAEQIQAKYFLKYLNAIHLLEYTRIHHGIHVTQFVEIRQNLVRIRAQSHGNTMPHHFRLRTALLPTDAASVGAASAAADLLAGASAPRREDGPGWSADGPGCSAVSSLGDGNTCICECILKYYDVFGVAFENTCINSVFFCIVSVLR